MGDVNAALGQVDWILLNWNAYHSDILAINRVS